MIGKNKQPVRYFWEGTKLDKRDLLIRKIIGWWQKWF